MTAALPNPVSCRRAWPVTLLALILLCAACGEDSPTTPTTGTITGVISDVDSGAPVPDVSVVAVAPATLIPAAGPAQTDSQGRYTIAGLPAGDYAVFVYHCTKVLFDRAQPLAHVTVGQSATLDMRLIAPESWWNCSGYHIAGTVVDSVTNEPLSGAYVGAALWSGLDAPTLFAGIGTPAGGVTDASGRFRINGLEIIVGYPIVAGGLAPIIVTCAGYEPLFLVGEKTPPNALSPAVNDTSLHFIPLPLPTGPDSTLTVTVRLRPSAGSTARTGALRGRAVWLDQPVAGLPVALSLLWMPQADTLHSLSVPLTPVPERTTVTDEQGRFVIAGLKPGLYMIQAGYMANDGYGDGSPPFSPPPSAQWYRVIAPDTLDTGDIPVMKGVEVLAPLPGSGHQSRTPELRWRAVQPPSGYQVTGYDVHYSLGYNSYAGVVGDAADTLWTFPESRQLPAGAHVRWYVEAWGTREGGPPGNSMVIAATEAPATFEVAPN